MLTLSRAATRLFRVNVGRAWAGSSAIKVTHSNRQTIKLEVGDMVVRKARPFRTGLPAGFHDLVGWTTKEVTPDMVGKNVAIYTSIEVKKEKGRASKEQLNHLEVIKKAGGLTGIARTTDEAQAIVKPLT